MCMLSYSLCQRLGLTRSVRNKPRARSVSIERRRHESPPEGQVGGGADAPLDSEKFAKNWEK